MQFRAKQLYNAGYKTLSHLANADPAVLCGTLEHLYQKQANLMVASAKVRGPVEPGWVWSRGPLLQPQLCKLGQQQCGV